MSGPRIYTGAEALALREAAEHPVAPAHTHTLTLTTGETALLHAAPSLAASVAHHEARAERAEAERERLLPRKGEHVNELYACVARVLSRLGVQDHGGDPLEALESWADEEHERSLAETDARNTIAADRDAAIAHAAELEAALREARAGLDNAVATVARLRGELAAAAADRDALRAEVSAALGLPPTIGPAPGELARIMRATEEARDVALRGACPRGYAVVPLAQADAAANGGAQ